MQQAVLAAEQRSALSSLKPAADRGFYLGGTGLCLRLGHRRSVDIDLFREAPFDPAEMLRELEAEGLVVSDVRTQPNTLWIQIAGVPVSLMRFPYPPIGLIDTISAVPVASLEDIAAMKVEVIASRGARKDFYDLYFICRHLGSLAAALDAFEARFASAHPDLIHRLKALTYFEDAEREPEPMLLIPVTWQGVRDFFEAEVRNIWARS